MDSLLFFRDLALSLAIGLLIGVERGWRSRDEQPGRRVAGLRTFGLLGLLGGTIGLAGSLVHPIAAVVLLAGTVGVLVAGYIHDMRADGHVSATTAVASLLTLCLGVLATNGYAKLAVASAAVVTLLLSLRQQLHGWLKGLSETDVQAVARFAIITAAILPLLPDQRYGPYDAWNPRELWLVVVLVTGFSFAGYVANRRLGPTRGTLATAVIGGLYSSTAVTAALSQRLRDGGEPASLLSAGIALASAVMFLRVLILTAVLAAFALPGLVAIIGPAALVAVGLSVWAVRRSTDGSAAVETRSANPFELVPALGFALAVAALALAARWAETRFGDAGIATLLAITGAFDVDAAIVTMGGLAPGTLSAKLAAAILAIPVLLNTLFKTAIVIANAGWPKGLRAAAPLLASALTLLLALLFSL